MGFTRDGRKSSCHCAGEVGHQCNATERHTRVARRPCRRVGVVLVRRHQPHERVGLLAQRRQACPDSRGTSRPLAESLRVRLLISWLRRKPWEEGESLPHYGRQSSRHLGTPQQRRQLSSRTLPVHTIHSSTGQQIQEKLKTEQTTDGVALCRMYVNGRHSLSQHVAQGPCGGLAVFQKGREDRGEQCSILKSIECGPAGLAECLQPA
mmetsp:Transcript_27585/g.79370  ORF Transcript_27585/g.79370 Transcript_27585/m.79370 type:complete len:208 (-) Transcript_27585:1623-2246(-)